MEKLNEMLKSIEEALSFYADNIDTEYGKQAKNALPILSSLKKEIEKNKNEEILSIINNVGDVKISMGRPVEGLSELFVLVHNLKSKYK